MGGGVSKDQREALLNSVRKGDVYRLRAHLEHMRGSAARVINGTRDSDDINLLCIAVRRASEPCLLALLEARGDPNQVCGQAKSTPLLLVAEHVSDELSALSMARAMLNAKANINYCNIFGQTPLYSCAVRTGETLLAYMIKRGAKVNNHWNKIFVLDPNPNPQP